MVIVLAAILATVGFIVLMRLLWLAKRPSAPTTVITIGFLFVFSRQLLEAYESTTGQLWLLLVAAVFALGGWLLRVYGQIDMPERFAARTTSGPRT